MASKIEKKRVKKISDARQREKDYIKDNLLYYIDKEKKTYRCVSDDMWIISEDRETTMRRLLLDYILEHLNLDELYTIFYSQTCYYLNPNIIAEARQRAIENINEDNRYTSVLANRMKRKVWDMNPILFGLILELIHESDLFWDAKHQEGVLHTFYLPGDE
jgi:hypothetical protein